MAIRDASAVVMPQLGESLPSQHLAPRPLGADGMPRRASPVARRVARERNIDLANVAGSGRGGRITRDDVVAYQPAATRGRVYKAPAYEPMPGDQVVPF